MAKELKYIVKVVNKSISGLSKVTSSFSSFGSRMKSLSKGIGIGIAAGLAAITAGIVGVGIAIKKSIGNLLSYGDNIDKMAKRTGASTDELQEMAYVLELNGASLNQYNNAMIKASRFIEKFREGNKKAQEQAAALGLTLSDFDGKSAVEATNLIGSAIANLSRESQKTALSFEILGRNGTDLIPTFKNGVDSIEAMRKEARELGLVLSNQTINNSAKATDEVGKLGKIFEFVKMQIASAFLPTLIQLSQSFVKFWKGFNESGGLENAIGNLEKKLMDVWNALEPLRDAISNVFSEEPTIKSDAWDKLKDESIAIANEAGEKIGEALARGIGKGIVKLLAAPFKLIQESFKLSEAKGREVGSGLRLESMQKDIKEKGYGSIEELRESRLAREASRQIISQIKNTETSIDANPQQSSSLTDDKLDRMNQNLESIKQNLTATN